MAEPMSTAARLIALMNHLGIEKAHLATQVPADVGEFARMAAERIGGLVLCVPTRLDTAPFVALASRLLLLAGDKGLTVDIVGRAVERLPGARRATLADYEAAGWSDVVKDRTDDVVRSMTGFLGGIDGMQPAVAGRPRPAGAAGEHAGLTWQIDGDGPPLLLLPFFLAPSQWDPAVARLAEQFTVIRVGGPNIGGIAALEDRARAPTYRAMFHTLVDLLALGPQARILDVGCGSGVLDRMLAQHAGPDTRIDALDLNPFFLREASKLAQAEGLGDRIAFHEMSATALPFEDASFDAVFSVTVLEECDADQAIAEMVRVAKPGARIGIVVRAIDVGQWWNLDLTPAMHARASVPPQSVGRGGVADRSLYRRMRGAGLVDLQPFPAMITLDRAGGPIWRYREDAVLPLLDAQETEIWRRAVATASADGVLMQCNVLHAAVATKPA